jgi:hypothetical protein
MSRSLTRAREGRLVKYKRSKRPQLEASLAVCKKHKAKLVRRAIARARPLLPEILPVARAGVIQAIEEITCAPRRRAQRRTTSRSSKQRRLTNRSLWNRQLAISTACA